MDSSLCPVDVISLCSVDGEIRPLRLRICSDQEEAMRIQILDSVKIKEIPYAGVEAHIFRCRGRAGEREMVFDLKYNFRSHSWCLLRRLH